MKLKKNILKNSIIIFCICLIVHFIEVIFIRTDETFFAECFINKVFGILVLFVLLKLLNKKWSDIGFKKDGMLRNIIKGILFCVIFYSIGFIIEFLVLKMQNTPGHIEFFVTGFSLTGNVVKYTGFLFVLMCVFFNVINVWMEEGLFRGFYIEYLNKKYDIRKAIFISALLFGLWHLITPIRSFIDGDMNFISFIIMSVGYVVLSGIMGIKWGLLYKMTGSVWMGLADHFFNNCIVTNLLHVVTSTGVDEMQIARVLIGELTSFVAILIYMKFKKIKIETFEKEI